MSDPQAKIGAASITTGSAGNITIPCENLNIDDGGSLLVAGFSIGIIIDHSDLERLSPEGLAHFTSSLEDCERQGLIGRVNLSQSTEDDSPDESLGDDYREPLNILVPSEGVIKYVLFETPEAAQEVAYALQADWDGCNGVKIRDFDLEAFKVATGLVRGEWCNFRDSELLPRDEPLGDWSQAVATDLNRLQIAFPISRAELYWAIADWKGSHSAESLSNSLGFSKSTVQGHLSALEKAGAIRSQGRPKQYTLAEDCPPEYLAQLQPLAEVARTTRCYWRSGHDVMR